MPDRTLELDVPDGSTHFLAIATRLVIVQLVADSPARATARTLSALPSPGSALLICRSPFTGQGQAPASPWDGTRGWPPPVCESVASSAPIAPQPNNSPSSALN